jgi:DNA-binding MarR family transcriptional regulator
MLKKSPAKFDVADCNCLTLRRAARQVSIYYDKRLAPTGIRATQFTMLAFIGCRGEVSVHEVGEALGLDRTTAGKNLRFLERTRMIKIASDPRDARKRSIKLSGTGQTILEAAYPFWREAQEEFDKKNGKAFSDRLRIIVGGMRA